MVCGFFHVINFRLEINGFYVYLRPAITERLRYVRGHRRVGSSNTSRAGRCSR